MFGVGFPVFDMCYYSGFIANFLLRGNKTWTPGCTILQHSVLGCELSLLSGDTLTPNVALLGTTECLEASKQITFFTTM